MTFLVCKARENREYCQYVAVHPTFFFFTLPLSFGLSFSPFKIKICLPEVEKEEKVGGAW